MKLKRVNHRKEIKNLLYRFIFDQIEAAMTKNSSLKLRFLAAYIQLRFLKNDIRALFMFMAMESTSKVPFEWLHIVFKAKADIEERMDSEKLDSMRLDVKKVYKFTNNL